jgi:hypothetical protein
VCHCPPDTISDSRANQGSNTGSDCSTNYHASNKSTDDGTNCSTCYSSADSHASYAITNSSYAITNSHASYAITNSSYAITNSHTSYAITNSSYAITNSHASYAITNSNNACVQPRHIPCAAEWNLSELQCWFLFKHYLRHVVQRMPSRNIFVCAGQEHVHTVSSWHV